MARTVILTSRLDPDTAARVCKAAAAARTTVSAFVAAVLSQAVQQVRADMQSFRNVTGTVVGKVSGRQRLKVSSKWGPLIVGETLVLEVETDDVGRFQFKVPEGQYELSLFSFPEIPTTTRTGGRVTPAFVTATASSFSIANLPGVPIAPLPDIAGWSGHKTISVGRVDVSGVTLEVSESRRISGRLVFDKLADRSAIDLSRVLVVPLNTAGILGRYPVSGVLTDLSFRTIGLPPGTYQLTLAPGIPGWGVSSVVQQGRSPPGDAIVVAGEDISDVEVRLVAGYTTLNGSVRLPTGKPASGSTVVIFPADPTFWSTAGPLSPRFVEVRANQDGFYETSLMQGGEYVIAPMLDGSPDWQRPSVLEALRKSGQRLKIEANRTTTLTTNLVTTK